MATKQSTVDFVLEQISSLGAVSAKKMFGEFSIYCDGKVVTLVCDDELFIKPTLGGRDFLGGVREGQPYPGAKPCFIISGDQWDDHEWLTQLIRITASQLPMPKKEV